MSIDTATISDIISAYKDAVGSINLLKSMLNNGSPHHRQLAVNAAKEYIDELYNLFRLVRVSPDLGRYPGLEVAVTCFDRFLVHCGWHVDPKCGDATSPPNLESRLARVPSRYFEELGQAGTLFQTVIEEAPADEPPSRPPELQEQGQNIADPTRDSTTMGPIRNEETTNYSEPDTKRSAASAGGRRKGIDEKMIVRLRKNPEAVNWSARRWADALKCSPSSVHGTNTWKQLMQSREGERIARKMRQSGQQGRSDDD